MSLRIGIDIDGTLYPWTQAVNEAVMHKFGVPDPGPHVEWDHLKKLLTSEQFGWIWTDEAAIEVFGRLDLVWDGAVHAVKELFASGYNVHFVTHRSPKRLSSVTGTWLAYHFDGYQGVHTLDNSMRKCDLGDWDVFIDDKIETVEEFLSERELVYLLMPVRDWNEQDPSLRPFAQFDRFRHWHEVPDLIADWIG